MTTDNYVWDKVEGKYHPALYPIQGKTEQWALPDAIRTDFGKLNAIIETKYTREYLKICAFYNKLFPSLKHLNWTNSSYNVPPFTAMDQERNDTGTGVSSNYLKQIIDQIVSRLGTVTFEPKLIADIPTLEYIVYKEEVERILRKIIRNDKLNSVAMEVFHDASILGYSHVIIDPITHKWIKANDYEVGLFEAQFNKDEVRQLLYRDYAFPVTSLVPYLASSKQETKDKLIEDVGDKTTVDFKMYFDCPAHKAYVTINNTTLEGIEYPFDVVQMVTFSWDIGFSKVTSTSLFDLLYPIQRELNKLKAKIQQLIRMYKGAVPVFNNDVDLAMKSISNGTGEALYVDSTRPIDSLMTVINPTPLDPALNAEVTAYKTEMFELAGVQQASFDMENFRSAAAVIALDQTRDTVFQSQMAGYANFVKKMFRVYVDYNAKVDADKCDSVEWVDIKALIDSAVITLKPVHVSGALGESSEAEGEVPPDYTQIQLARCVIKILKGDITYEAIGYTIDTGKVTAMVATAVVKLSALNIEIPKSADMFLMSAFIEDIKNGAVTL